MLFADNGNGVDVDIDGDTFDVIGVNGAPLIVGQPITLPSGALLTVNADGTFTYDPNGAFDSLDAGEQATDQFSYQISDGVLDPNQPTFGEDLSLQRVGELNGGIGLIGTRLIGGDTTAFSFLGGRNVIGAGDVNGDGIDDVVIGAPSDDNAGAGFDRNAYVLFGRDGGLPADIDLTALDGTDGFALTGLPVTDPSGTSVALGDVNGDDIADIIVGSPDARPNNRDEAGQTHVVFGSASGFTSQVDVTSLDGANGFVVDGVEFSRSGSSVAALGDVNGDGVGDFIIGTPLQSFDDQIPRVPDLLVGGATLVFGQQGARAATLDLASFSNRVDGIIYRGTTTQEGFGFAVSTLGDINGDGVDDFAIGAPGFGRVYVVYGETSGGLSLPGGPFLRTLDGSRGFIIEDLALNGVGRSVAGAGDVNGDGIGDIVIGAPIPPNSNSNSKAYVLFGQRGTTQTTFDLSDLMPAPLAVETGVKDLCLLANSAPEIDWVSLSPAPATLTATALTTW